MINVSIPKVTQFCMKPSSARIAVALGSMGSGVEEELELDMTRVCRGLGEQREQPGSGYYQVIRSLIHSV